MDLARFARDHEDIWSTDGDMTMTTLREQRIRNAYQQGKRDYYDNQDRNEGEAACRDKDEKAAYLAGYANPGRPARENKLY